jgi:uncharacterized protein YecE (DUF72 family)
MKTWIGTSGFQYPEWKGKFYPATMPAAKMLAYYSERFSTTEVNYTFRSIPSEAALSRWSAATPDDFRFSFKAPQRVTHFAKLKGCAEVLDVFAKAISKIAEKAGIVLFQLPPTFKKDAPLLEGFLATLPLSIRATFEFRHPSWLEDDEVLATLRRHNAALCIAETEELDATQVATADFGYLRLRREDYTGPQIERWAEFIQSQEAQWREAFIYFKHEEEAVGPKFAQQLIGILGQR